ncbi:MAG TPA: putative sulfate exporter family transporter [Propioniciclava sp.]|uniref:YeiH family protein n=1 Tax=Propioniciclava sp. TaxID=2038686 RepID=UPI002C42ABA2|nr:putative sulfate exporter family transporter [Propioniciclava sp.]HRL49899.1 putative sulfate exporter family transporter [Propioniciclava sp.]HRL79649.1 putative sulfate exporter family transporter [Propioniciclava sp.]
MKSLLPGLAVCAVAATAAVLINLWVPVLSALLVAILLGMLVGNLTPLPQTAAPGVAYSSKRLLRIGVVLLGLQVSLGDIAGLGWGMVAVVIAVVGLTFILTLLIGRALGLSTPATLLVASGFSICGAAAVAACDGVIDARDEEVASALAQVVLFGTAMIAVIPVLSGVLGLSEHQAGLWAGSSVHEVAQVVAAAGIIGPAALSVAVVVKLARVVLLAPVMAALSLWQRRRHDAGAGAGTRPPLVPLFVLGFLAAVVVASLGVLPANVLAAVKVLQTLLLSAAMFALGTGVNVRKLLGMGGRPIALGASATVIVTLLGLGGVLLTTR